jgi:hypothetical protein
MHQLRQNREASEKQDYLHDLRLKVKIVFLTPKGLITNVQAIKALFFKNN